MKRIPTTDDLRQLLNGPDWIYEPEAQLRLVAECDFSMAEVRSAIPVIMESHMDGSEYQKALKAVKLLEAYIRNMDLPPGAV